MPCTASGHSSYSAVFVNEEVEESEEEEEETDEDESDETEGTDSGEEAESETSDESQEWIETAPAYAFTASRAEQAATSQHTPNDVDKHVSIGVDCPDLKRKILLHQLPRLFIKRWATGLCFFTGCPQKDVLFPFPASWVEM